MRAGSWRALSPSSAFAVESQGSDMNITRWIARWRHNRKQAQREARLKELDKELPTVVKDFNNAREKGQLDKAKRLQDRISEIMAEKKRHSKGATQPARARCSTLTPGGPRYAGLLELPSCSLSSESPARSLAHDRRTGSRPFCQSFGSRYVRAGYPGWISMPIPLGSRWLERT